MIDHEKARDFAEEAVQSDLIPEVTQLAEAYLALSRQRRWLKSVLVKVEATIAELDKEE